MIQEPERLQRSHRDGTLRRASIPEAISAYAAANGNDIAVADRSRRLSYGALERESNRVAALLRDLGAGPERCVGILLERSAEFVVAALAVLKTGAAYVPL
ncbi:MAG: AMP-binding protein, partial [Candidatus Eremiobacteraeota bacterium]|nr:AMP-binding protein [Candidatus Eremiobacteraeota bacterium]